MYLDALEFLEEEHDAWAPFEALADLTDDAAGASRRGGPRLVRPRPDGPPARVAGGRRSTSLRELAVSETSPTIARVDADWDTRGGEVVNAEIQADWAALPDRRAACNGSGRSPASCAAT